MVKRRKTVSERRQASHEEDERSWRAFYSKLSAVQSHIDALRLLSEAPAPDSPGRRYYSNLGFFLQSYAAPAGASFVELNEYHRLIRLFDQEGMLKKGVLPEIEETLLLAIRRRIA
jgi:hypothetical protein